jgi:hypothetical protein
VWLYRAKSTPIKRHIKVQGEANPYDPAYETYFEDREGSHMLDTFRGTKTLRFLWMEQHGLCPLCNAFYFIQSATTGFTVSTFPYRSRVSLKEAFAGLEPDEYESLTSGS